MVQIYGSQASVRKQEPVIGINWTGSPSLGLESFIGRLHRVVFEIVVVYAAPSFSNDGLQANTTLGNDNQKNKQLNARSI